MLPDQIPHPRLSLSPPAAAMPSPAADLGQELAAARRVLAVRLDNTGDVIMTGPALRAIKAALPDASITLMASRAGALATPLLPWIDSVIVLRPVWQDTLNAVPFDPDRELEFARALRGAAFDAAFVFTSFNQSPDVPGYVAYLAGIPIRVGHAALFSGGVFNLPVAAPPFETHQVDRNLALVRAAGIAAADHDLEIVVPESARDQAAALLAEQSIDPDEKYIALAPGASSPARRYDADRFGRLAGAIGSQLGLPVVIVGSEGEAGLVRDVIRAADGAWPFGRVANLAGLTSLSGLAAVIERASLLVANDSGPMHIADALGRPEVVLFAGTELESQWEPRRSPSTLLRRPTACAPCYLTDCPFGLPCLDIPPERVLAEIASLLARQPGFETFSAENRTTVQRARQRPRPAPDLFRHPGGLPRSGLLPRRTQLGHAD